MSCSRKRFNCLENGCQYSTGFLNRYLWNTWDKHSTSCVRHYKNLQSFRRHVKGEHKWFFEKYMITCKTKNAEASVVNQVNNSEPVNVEIPLNLANENEREEHERQGPENSGRKSKY